MDIPGLYAGLTKSADFIALENKHGAHNYHPMPVVIAKGRDSKVWDVENKEYYDFLSGYSAVSQGHCHPRIIRTMRDQMGMLTLTGRAFYNTLTGPYTLYITRLFGFDKVLPMNSGAEGGETAVKLCRKWAYTKKGVEQNKAKIIMCNGNFWGRTIAACSSSSNEDCYKNYGPFTPGFELIPYNDIPALQQALEDPNVAGFYVEPVQGEAGVIVPDTGYIAAAHSLCKAKNVLFIADEIQCGLARCGSMMACSLSGVKPDILILGKALSGGMMPISAVLANDDVMLCMEPGTHGSTFGGNPLACAVACTAVQVLMDENLSERAVTLGVRFREYVQKLSIPWITEVRGLGLLNAIEIDTNKVDAHKVCMTLMKHGILTKPTHEKNIRMAPPLVMTDEEMEDALLKIRWAFTEVTNDLNGVRCNYIEMLTS